jgi:small subunit ribosomal protein S9
MADDRTPPEEQPVPSGDPAAEEPPAAPPAGEEQPAAEEPVAAAPEDQPAAEEQPAAAEPPAAAAEGQPPAAADEPPAAAEEPVAAAPGEQPAAVAPDEADGDVTAEPEAEFDEDEEEPAPRVKPEIPGADLEVDIVEEGVDPLARERLEQEQELEEAAEEAQEAAEDQPIAAVSIDLGAEARYRATGKRKTAIARVMLRPGTGAYTVNGRPLEIFFPRGTLQRNIRQPLEAVGYGERMDVVARLQGGGVSAQAGALRHGISRALLEADPNLRGELKRRGFLTRDPRVKERKKAGLKKARKRPQFSKR